MAFMWKFLLVHIFLLYSMVFTTTGIHILAVITTGIATICLFIFKVPKPPKDDVDEVLQVYKVPIIAHRGAGQEAPENTLAAIRLAKQNGADAIEFDVDYSADGEAVVIHDSTVDRTTNGSGHVNHMSLERLRTLDAAAKHPRKVDFPDEKIPTLEETVQLCLELGLHMYIDVKGNPHQSVATLTALYKKFPELYRCAAVCSFYPQIIYMVRRADPRIVGGLTHRYRYVSREGDYTEKEGSFVQKLWRPLVDVALEWAVYSWLWYLCGTSVFLMRNKETSATTVKHFTDRELKVVVWTANAPQEKAYLKDILKVAYMTDTLKED